MRLPANTPLFTVPEGLIRILDRDLVAAGIAKWVEDPKTGKMMIDKRDDRGRTLDVHALRTTFGTHLSKGGVSLRTAQAAMRHSKPDLTANVYTDPKLLDVAAALNALPLLPLAPRPDRQAMKATGTDSRREVRVGQIAPLIALAGGNSGESADISGHGGKIRGGRGSERANHINSVCIKKNGSQSNQDYEPSSQAGEGGRTLDIHVGNVTLYH
jgi:hypothetical protein